MTIKIVIRIVVASVTFWRLVSGLPPGGGRGGAYGGGMAFNSKSNSANVAKPGLLD